MSNHNPMVTVRTRCNLSEETVLYPAGSEFETSLERAEALGDAVTILIGAKESGDEQGESEDDAAAQKKSKKGKAK